MPDVNAANTADAPNSKAADPAAKAKKKKAKSKSRSTSLGAARLQVATQLLAQVYSSHGENPGGIGTARLEAALKVADELIALNAKLPQSSKKAKTGGKPGAKAAA
jgi:hypothetical protein